jgi:GNAT superfamily N-acetyltransferase
MNHSPYASVIRFAVPDDASEILRLIRELADFEKLDPPDSNAQKRLIEDAFSETPPFKVLLAEFGDRAVGYAFYFFSYSSFLAKKTLYLEDIYISNDFRGLGIGKQLINHLQKIASDNNCGRMEWVVLDWNKSAIDFYEKLGARELKEWKTYRLVISEKKEY